MILARRNTGMVAPTYTTLGRGYRAVGTAVREGRVATNESGAEQMRFDRTRLIAQSREFMRDNAIYRGMINRVVSYTIGSGFELQPGSANKQYNKRANALWKEYWRSPSVQGLIPGTKVEEMMAREMFAIGDLGVLKQKGDGLIQLVEAEQIVGASTSDHGLVTDAAGKPSAMLVAPWGRGSIERQKRRPIKLDEEGLFMGNPDRPSDLRTVPPCQASFPIVHRINDVLDAEAIAWQILSRMSFSHNAAGAADAAYETSAEDPAQAGRDGQASMRITNFEYGTIFHGEPGETITSIDRNLPGKDFPASVKMFLRLFGLPMGLPVEIILLDWTSSNYSQSRAVLEQAFQTFKGWQNLFRQYFYSKIYTWKVAQWVLEGKLPRRKDGMVHEWIMPTFPWIDQLKEAQAHGLRVDRGFTSYAIVCKSLGLEREEVIKQKDLEIREAIEIAKKIEADLEVEVDWRTFAGMRLRDDPEGRPAGDQPAGGNDPDSATEKPE